MQTAILLVIMYLVCVGYFFITGKINRKKFLFRGILAILLFLLLTLNVWYSLLTIYGGNQILPPFVNKTMYFNTITSHSYYWLINPFSLIILTGLKFYYDKKHWKDYQEFEKVVSFLMGLFFILSTNLFPWKFLSKLALRWVDTIQFPFRFFVPFILLLIFSLGKISTQVGKKWEKYHRWLVVISVIQALCLVTWSARDWQTRELPVDTGKHTKVLSDDYQEVKDSFFMTDKQVSLDLIQKATPDYLPIYSENQANKYGLYEALVIDQNPQFIKEVKDGKLCVSWEGIARQTRNIPVIIYHQTNIHLNGRELPKNQVTTSTIGTLIISEESGKNNLEISYPVTTIFKVLLFITGVSWLVIGYLTWQDSRQRHV